MVNDDPDEDERVNDEHEDYQKEHNENGCYMMNDDVIKEWVQGSEHEQ